MLTPLEFWNDLTNPLLSFLPKALLVTLMAAIVCGVVGTHVVLRGMAFVGDAVSHSVFPGLAIAFVLQGSLLLGGLISGVVTAVLVAVFSQARRLREDSVIGVFFVAAFALGIVIMSRAPGYGGSLTDFLFGSITGIPDSEVLVVAVSSLGILLIAALAHRRFIAVSLDAELAKASRIPVLALDILLYVLVTLCVVISVRTIGNILVLALLVTPAATARLLTDRLGRTMGLAAAFGCLATVLGLYFSWAIDLPAGGSIVLVSTGFFCAAMLLAPQHGALWKVKNLNSR